jgi:hypothetical protein
MGVHPRLGRGDAASGLLYSGGRFQARREMTRLHIGNAHLPFEFNFCEISEPGTWNLEPGTHLTVLLAQAFASFHFVLEFDEHLVNAHVGR